MSLAISSLSMYAPPIGEAQVNLSPSIGCHVVKGIAVYPISPEANHEISIGRVLDEVIDASLINIRLFNCWWEPTKIEPRSPPKTGDNDISGTISIGNGMPICSRNAACHFSNATPLLPPVTSLNSVTKICDHLPNLAYEPLS